MHGLSSDVVTLRDVHFQAPEVITGRGYGMAADFWALGVVLYEMLIGRSPFEHSNPKAIHAKILAVEKDGVPFPPDFPKHHAAATSLITALMTFNPQKRLGCKAKGSKELQGHAFFKGINWAKLLHREVEPPFKPVFDESKIVKPAPPRTPDDKKGSRRMVRSAAKRTKLTEAPAEGGNASHEPYVRRRSSVKRLRTPTSSMASQASEADDDYCSEYDKFFEGF